MVTKRALTPITIMMGCLFCLAVGLTTASAPSNNEQTEGVEIKIETDGNETLTPDSRNCTGGTCRPGGGAHRVKPAARLPLRSQPLLGRRFRHRHARNAMRRNARAHFHRQGILRPAGQAGLVLAHLRGNG